MIELASTVLRAALSGFQSHSQLVLENLALRHQLSILYRTSPQSRLRDTDRLLWVFLDRVLLAWQKVLFLIQPQTVIKWHRLGFRLYWRWKSKNRNGRPPLDRKLISLIRRMWQANPIWGSRRIQAELAKLGISVSDSTVRKDRPKCRRSSPTWKTFLQGHVQDLVAIDFFTVPTATCGVLFVFLVLAHHRRRILHFNITDSPSAAWTGQQLVEAFPYSTPPRY